MPIKILDVGQCGFDGPRMSRLLREKLDATVDRAATEEDATRRLTAGKYNLVQFDARRSIRRQNAVHKSPYQG